MKTFTRLVLLLIFVPRIQAQERLGIANSNYASSTSIFLNPSSSVDSRTYMQLNLIGGNAFESTNMAYLPDFKIWPALFNQTLPDPVPRKSKTKEYILVNASGEGPAYVISKMDYGVGGFVRLRAVGNAKGIPYEVTTQLLEPNSELDSSTPIEIEMNKVSLREMTWGEYGINLGKMFRKEPSRLIAVGVNLKYLTGININYKMIKQLDAVLIDSVYHISILNTRDKYNEPAWNTGKGFGMDLGFTYKQMLKNINNYYVNSIRSNCTNIDYKYKIAASLIDFGYIKFKKNTYQLDADTTSITAHQDEPITVDLADKYVINEPIWAVTPAALSVQTDYNFENKVYLNLTVVKNLVPDRMVGVQGSNLLCLAPRYETQNIEVAMPFTLQQFKYPLLGLTFRLRSFTFGAENVIPFFVKANTKQVGIYFNLAVSFFKNPACNTAKRTLDDCKPGLKSRFMHSRLGRFMHLDRGGRR